MRRQTGEKMMRRVLWGLLMGVGAMLPSLAIAQEEHRAEMGQAEPAPPQRVERAARNEAQRRGDGGQGWRQRPAFQRSAPTPGVENAGQRYGWARGGAAQNADPVRGERWRRPQEQFRPADQPAPAQVRNDGPGAGRFGQEDGNGQRPRWNGGDGGRPAWYDGRRGFGGDRGIDRAPGRNDGRVEFRDNSRNDWQRDQRRSPSTGWQRDRADWTDHGRDDGRFDTRSSWNRSWRDDRRYDYNRYRAANRDAYHLPRYYAPYGWDGGYRRFSVGIRLNSILFAQNYWIDDPWDYRLPPADFPYRWVRYYDDALLVDVRYGEVVDVVYGIFW